MICCVYQTLLSEQIMTQRTSQQNRSLHLYFTLLADELNASGYDMRKTLQESIDIPWSPSSIKSFLWKPVQEAMLEKESTTELTTKDIDMIYDVINKTIGERTGVHVPFPSKDE